MSSKKVNKPDAGGCKHQGEIHLGDIITALTQLPWQNEEQAAAIVRSLGFTLKTKTSEQTSRTIIDTSRYPRRGRTTKPPAGNKPRITAPPPPQPPVDLPTKVLQSELKQLTVRAAPQAPQPGWLKQESKRLESDDTSHQPLSRISLFPDRTCRGILSAALATRRLGHEIDVRRLIEQSVRGQTPSNLPRLKSGTLERGCQLLLHFSDGMVPYWEDLKALTAQIGSIMGERRLQIYEFTEAPKAARRWNPPSSFLTWQPEQGIPVLVATDFGIAERESRSIIEQRWRPFIQACEDSGSPLLMLLPWPQSAWPDYLGRYPELIHWNPHTTAAMVRRVIGIGHEVVK